MNWAWATSLDQFWRSPAFPMWLTLAAAGVFAVILLLTLLRAEKSVANGALTVITLLAVGIAVAATIRSFGPGGSATTETGPSSQMTIALPALACIDDLAGETVGTACEKALFGSPDAAAAAVSYAAGRVSHLTAQGDVATANKAMTSDLEALRRSIERDRYGLMAFVLMARDRCKPTDCAAFRSLTDHNQIAANMEERTYDGLVARYASAWNAAPAIAAATAAAVPQLASVPTGKPTNAEFPSSASIPPVNIMTPEPSAAGALAAPRPTANAQSVAAPRPAATAANAPSTATPRPPAAGGAAATSAVAAAPKKPPAPKTRASAPVQLAPAPPSDDN
jgi:hypothetical protein